ncbi:MAG: winged helix-turn-helix domain-containing protein [Candidatus Helarchaeota archaeon]
MDDQIESEGVKGKSRKLKGKKNIKEDLLNLLKNSSYGLNISKIAKGLNLSRNTVKKYLGLLRKEQLIEKREIGRSKIYFVKKRYKKYKVDIFRNHFFEFTNNLYDALEKMVAQLSVSDIKGFFKQLGNEMGKNSNLPDLETTDIDNLIKNRRHYLYYIADVSKQWLELYNQMGKEMIRVEIVPSTPDNMSAITLRVENPSKEFGDSELFYYLWGGFYETILRDNFGDNIYLDILDVQKENSCCYFEISIR